MSDGSISPVVWNRENASVETHTANGTGKPALVSSAKFFALPPNLASDESPN